MQPLDVVRARRMQVVRLGGIRAQVVQLGLRGERVLERTDPQATQLRPTEIDEAEQAFEILRAFGGFRTVKHGDKRNAVGFLERPETRQLGERRCQVGQPDRFGDAARTECARPVDDPGNPERPLVDEQTVRRLAVLAETLAVVRNDHDQGVAPTLRVGQPLQEPVELTVDVSDFAVVAR